MHQPLCLQTTPVIPLPLCHVITLSIEESLGGANTAVIVVQRICLFKRKLVRHIQHQPERRNFCLSVTLQVGQQQTRRWWELAN